MTRAYVLLTAMPPTVGHLHLIQFAAELAETHVIVNTQPSEPYPFQRVQAIEDATRDMLNVHVHHIHKFLPQEPAGREGFWDMWVSHLTMFGFQPGDYIVASEMYGRQLAEFAGGVFMPYDLDRFIIPTKATRVRNNTLHNFRDVLPEFRHHLIKRVTVFGAESVGKTTLTRDLAVVDEVGGDLWAYPLFEWARPYLEHCGNTIDRDTMTTIWKGQAALQASGTHLLDRPLVFQDTDLYSTIGYWEMWTDKLGPVPDGLIRDAHDLRSDLYIMPLSNIPFEPDPLRYGGDHREGSDDYWRSVLDKYELPYELLPEKQRAFRAGDASRMVAKMWNEKNRLEFKRVTA